MPAQGRHLCRPPRRMPDRFTRNQRPGVTSVAPTTMTLISEAIPSEVTADERLRIVIIGLTITSSWGNGHATTYRGLVRELVRRGHEVLFLEHDKPWYAQSRDLPRPPYGRTELYSSVDELRDRF